MAQTEKDVYLVEEVRKAVRRYKKGIRRAKNPASRRVLEDRLVTWIFTQIRKERNASPGSGTICD